MTDRVDGPGVPSRETVEDLLRLASRDYSGRNYDRARDHLAKAQRAEPQSPSVLLWQARVAMRRESWADLKSASDELLKLQAPTAEVLQYRATALTNLEDWGGATDAWQAVAEFDPEDIDAWVQCASSASRNGRKRQARAAAAKLVEIASGDEKVLELAGGVLLQAGALDDARRVFRDLAEQHWGIVEQAYGRSVEEGDIRAAAVLLSTLRLTARDDRIQQETVCDALMREAVHAERQGFLESAVLDLRAASMLSPDDPLIKSGLRRLDGLILSKAEQDAAAGSIATALESIIFFLDITPDNLVALRLLAKVQTQSGDKAAAIVAWETLLRYSPGEKKALRALAKLQELVGDFPKAWATWEQLLHIAPDDGEARRELVKLPKRMLGLGKLLYDKEMYIEAWNIISQIPEQADVVEDCRRRLLQAGRSIVKQIRANYRSDRYEEVLRATDAVFSTLWKEPEAYRIIARSAMKQRRFDIALKGWLAYQEAALGSSVEVGIGLARCHVAIGDFESARDELAKVVALDPTNPHVPKIEAQLARQRRGPA